MKQTCYHCVHADFRTPSKSEMRGFAKCIKARTVEEKHKYYFGGYECDKQKFENASPETMEKRKLMFEVWRSNQKSSVGG
jgi:hypothetical protein|nr:MAG TPA: hypothetical protein [Caudoviricetes sp.]DAY12524.1 MAG TPA: hypothetical protein [Caudoviricetes sp.]